jgi:DNA polymerase/3'-5' exonuclease PolX
MIADAPEEKEEAKVKYPRVEALGVARELCVALKPLCERLIVAGSLRRIKKMVGDVELLFIPRMEERPDPGDLFGALVPCDLARLAIEALVAAGVFEKRLSKTGHPSWGARNMLARHVATGIPVDFFVTEERSWWNYLVCRTGGARSNEEIACAAKERGWKWNPYGCGFSRGGPLTGREFEERKMVSEEDVFHFVGLPFKKPEERE